MLKQRCLAELPLTTDLCPYKHKVVEQSRKFAEARATYYCLSIPCLYRIEQLLSGSK